MEEKEFEDLKDLIVSFRLYFITIEDHMYLYHILFVTIK
jgi:hypothetical protein